MLFVRYIEQTSVALSGMRIKSASLTPSGSLPETPRGWLRGLSSIQAYCENDILLVSLEEDTERVRRRNPVLERISIWIPNNPRQRRRGVKAP
tara:strand:- start:26892 stop:27170 length:279 start_codon:yes stop_codon:yes gene_type:complete